MSQQDQWRFQWPDGTWIRWNPQTQSWEKEGPGAEGAVEVSEPHSAARDVETAMPDVVRDQRVEPEPLVEEAPPPMAESTGDESAVDEGILEPAPVASEPAASSTRRPMVGDVLPPPAEPERPGGSLWPTVLTGIVVGLGVGLALWQMIR